MASSKSSRSSKPAAPPNARTSRPRRFVLGISGASGAIYATRLLEQLLLADAEVHLVISDYGKRLLWDELQIKTFDFASLAPTLAPGGARRLSKPQSALLAKRLVIHPNKDVGAVIASGSFLHDGMVVLPCSSTSLGALASGSGSNLLTRAAMVTLKERRTLIVCHRESPLNLIDIEAMRTLTLAGAIIAPTNPGFYLLPKTIDEIVDFVVGKVLDLLKVEHDLKTRWEHANTKPKD